MPEVQAIDDADAIDTLSCRATVFAVSLENADFLPPFRRWHSVDNPTGDSPLCDWRWLLLERLPLFALSADAAALLLTARPQDEIEFQFHNEARPSIWLGPQSLAAVNALR